MSPLANARALNIVSLLVIVGLSFILIANLFSLTVLKVHVDRTLANIGSLLLITGILQFLYDAYVKKELFEAIQSKVVRDTTVRQSRHK